MINTLKFRTRIMYSLGMIDREEYQLRLNLPALQEDKLRSFLSSRYKHPVKILVHLHLFYKSLWPVLKNCLNSITMAHWDLFVSIPQQDDELIEEIKVFCPQAVIKVAENRGYDVAPFLDCINQYNLDEYDYVIKLHTKRDLEYPVGSFITRCIVNGHWRDSLLEFMSTRINFLKTLAIFELSPSVGMIGSDEYIFTVMGEQQAGELTEKELKRLGWTRYRTEFIGGTMFMVRASLFKIFQQGVTTKDFPSVTNHEASLAHVYERLFGFVVSMQNKKIMGFRLFQKQHKLQMRVNRFIHHLFGVDISQSGRYYLWILGIKLPIWLKQAKPQVKTFQSSLQAKQGDQLS